MSPTPDSFIGRWKATVEHFGKVDMLFANAGVSGAARFQDLGEDEWYRVVDIDLSGVYRVTPGSEPSAGTRRGRLDRADGQRVRQPGSSLLAPLLGSQGRGRQPRPIAGGLPGQGRDPGERAQPGVGRNRDDRWCPRPREVGNAAALARTPMRRWGEPADFAGPAVYLASDASRFMTGAELVVDGGFSAG